LITAQFFCITDGCNWGQQPKEASERAIETFGNYMVRKMIDAKTTKEVVNDLIYALAKAHYSIVRDKGEDPDSWVAGATTILGGTIVECERTEVSSGWVIIAVRLGDCKAFHYSMKEKTLTDLTEWKEDGDTSLIKDYGGSIGPTSNNWEPNLRNLSIIIHPCEQDDLLILTSDGVHDNFDPEKLGKKPKDLSISSIEKWEEVEKETMRNVKKTFMLNQLGEIINDISESPKDVTQKLIDYCMTVTSAGREYMEQNPSSILVDDYELYPGKMDHATCVSMKVGRYLNYKKEYTKKDKEVSIAGILSNLVNLDLK